MVTKQQRPFAAGSTWAVTGEGGITLTSQPCSVGNGYFTPDCSTSGTDQQPMHRFQDTACNAALAGPWCQGFASDRGPGHKLQLSLDGRTQLVVPFKLSSVSDVWDISFSDTGSSSLCAGKVSSSSLPQSTLTHNDLTCAAVLVPWTTGWVAGNAAASVEQKAHQQKRQKLNMVAGQQVDGSTRTCTKANSALQAAATTQVTCNNRPYAPHCRNRAQVHVKARGIQPCDLPPNVADKLQQLLYARDPSSLLVGLSVRSGCVLMTLDIWQAPSGATWSPLRAASERGAAADRLQDDSAGGGGGGGGDGRLQAARSHLACMRKELETYEAGCAAHVHSAVSELLSCLPPAASLPHDGAQLSVQVDTTLWMWQWDEAANAYTPHFLEDSSTTAQASGPTTEAAPAPATQRLALCVHSPEGRSSSDAAAGAYCLAAAWPPVHVLPSPAAAPPLPTGSLRSSSQVSGSSSRRSSVPPQQPLLLEVTAVVVVPRQCSVVGWQQGDRIGYAAGSNGSAAVVPAHQQLQLLASCQGAYLPVTVAKLHQRAAANTQAMAGGAAALEEHSLKVTILVPADRLLIPLTPLAAAAPTARAAVAEEAAETATTVEGGTQAACVVRLELWGCVGDSRQWGLQQQQQQQRQQEHDTETAQRLPFASPSSSDSADPIMVLSIDDYYARAMGGDHGTVAASHNSTADANVVGRMPRDEGALQLTSSTFTYEAGNSNSLNRMLQPPQTPPHHPQQQQQQHMQQPNSHHYEVMFSSLPLLLLPNTWSAPAQELLHHIHANSAATSSSSSADSSTGRTTAASSAMPAASGDEAGFCAAAAVPAAVPLLADWACQLLEDTGHWARFQQHQVLLACQQAAAGAASTGGQQQHIQQVMADTGKHLLRYVIWHGMCAAASALAQLLLWPCLDPAQASSRATTQRNSSSSSSSSGQVHQPTAGHQPAASSLALHTGPSRNTLQQVFAWVDADSSSVLPSDAPLAAADGSSTSDPAISGALLHLAMLSMKPEMLDFVLRLGTLMCGNDWVPDIWATNGMGLTPVQLAAAPWVPAAVCLQLLQVLRSHMAVRGAEARLDAAWGAVSAAPAGSLAAPPHEPAATGTSHAEQQLGVVVGSTEAHDGSTVESYSSKRASDGEHVGGSDTGAELKPNTGALAAVAEQPASTRSSVEINGSCVQLRRLQPLTGSAPASARTSVEHQHRLAVLAAEPTPALTSAHHSSQSSPPVDALATAAAAAAAASPPHAGWRQTCMDYAVRCHDAVAGWSMRTSEQEEVFQAWVRKQMSSVAYVWSVLLVVMVAVCLAKSAIKGVLEHDLAILVMLLPPYLMAGMAAGGKLPAAAGDWQAWFFVAQVTRGAGMAAHGLGLLRGVPPTWALVVSMGMEFVEEPCIMGLVEQLPPFFMVLGRVALTYGWVWMYSICGVQRPVLRAAALCLVCLASAVIARLVLQRVFVRSTSAAAGAAEKGSKVAAKDMHVGTDGGASSSKS